MIDLSLFDLKVHLMGIQDRETKTLLVEAVKQELYVIRSFYSSVSLDWKWGMSTNAKTKMSEDC